MLLHDNYTDVCKCTQILLHLQLYISLLVTVLVKEITPNVFFFIFIMLKDVLLVIFWHGKWFRIEPK